MPRMNNHHAILKVTLTDKMQTPEKNMKASQENENAFAKLKAVEAAKKNAIYF